MVTPNELDRALDLLTGDPELVIVDARVLRLLMGELSRLIILDVVAPSGQGVFRGAMMAGDDGPFVWDDDSPCN